jgi:uncharacterized protein (TIGR02145 family)
MENVKKSASDLKVILLSFLIVLFCSQCEKKHTLPIVSTNSVNFVTYTTASSGGNVTNEGGTEVIARGVCWNTNHSPTRLNASTSDGTGPGNFNSSITNLQSNTTYYLRAYAINDVGTGYGNEETFSTIKASVPNVSTHQITSISQRSALSGGEILSENGGSVNSKGICWGLNENPTTDDNKTVDGSGLGTFASTLTGLEASTTYHVRAYALNSAGTGYGNDLSFSTAAKSIPKLTTAAITSITPITAISGGKITDDGGDPILARGVCWSEATTNPTISNNKTSDGLGESTYISTLTGLEPSYFYWVRAYATNSTGTAYGNQLTFTTISTTPSITTKDVYSVTQISARSGGNITADGGKSVTERGVCWSLTPNPTTESNSKTSDGTGKAEFTSVIEGLSAGKTYYLRAYATNQIGTTYGNEVSFTTSTDGTSLTDIDGNVYNTVIIGSQTWMKEDLQTSKLRDGTNIPLVTDNGTWSGMTTPGSCLYDNNVESKNKGYGFLYNWYSIAGGNLCPVDWHVPSDSEWTTLSKYLLGQDFAGGKLKETGFSHWMSPNTNATDETGFKALPGGARNSSGTFLNSGYNGYWWSSTVYPSNNAWYWGMNYYDGILDRSYNYKRVGFSVRCIKD